ncbi:hypothetical protein HK405_011749 [Cladochytrium tenue]|nr:hypothetical protein HK405_011749 [Cladochytrium tenue]
MREHHLLLFSVLFLLYPYPSLGCVRLAPFADAAVALTREQVEQVGLDGEVRRVLAVFEQREAEDTWMQMDDALSRLVAVARGSAQLPGFVPSLQRLKVVLPQALATERTRLARRAMTLVEVLALSLGDRFEPLADFSVPALLRLCTRANKVIVKCASTTLRTVIEHAGIPSCVPLLAEALQSSSKSLRVSAADCLNVALEVNSPAKLDVYGDAVETALRLAVVDAAPEVRTLARTSFDLFQAQFPARLDRFLYGLPDVALKFLKVSRPASSSILRNMTPSKTKPGKEPLLSRADDAADTVSLAASSSKTSRRPYAIATPPRSVSHVSKHPSSIMEVGSDAAATSFKIADIASNLKSSDWSVRLRNLEALNGFVTASGLPFADPTIVGEVRSKLPRIYGVYLTGLTDSHSKCLVAAMIGLAALAEAHGCDDVILESLVPRLVGSFLLPSSANIKPDVIAFGRKLLDVLKTRKGGALCAMSAASALSSPEYSKSVRTRVGCLGLLAEMPDEEWSFLAKEKSTELKWIIIRLFAVADDTNLSVQKLLKPLFANISVHAADIFWGLWINTKPTQRENVNTLFGVKDISLNRNKLEAARMHKPPILTRTSLAVAHAQTVSDPGPGNMESSASYMTKADKPISFLPALPDLDDTKALQSRADKEFLSRLRALLHPLDMIDQLGEMSRMRLLETHGWLVQDVLNWYDQIQEESTFLLHGPVGTGKSVVFATVAEAMRERKSVLATFLCHRGAPGQSSPRRVLETILWQVLDSGAIVPGEVDHLRFLDREYLETAPLSSLFERLFTRIFSCYKGPTKLIMIDALDECASQITAERDEFLRLLGERTKLFPPTIRLFLTTRSRDDILSFFGSSCKYELRLDDTRHIRDTKLYSRSRMERISYMLPPADMPAATSLADNLALSSGGLFIWLSVAYDCFNEAQNASVADWIRDLIQAAL